ncbi:MAG: hypothetical protein KDB71_15985 [Mycobacterium sp.]|nr:hypothetical protein [Mycobacterium sp.]
MAAQTNGEFYRDPGGRLLHRTPVGAARAYAADRSMATWVVWARQDPSRWPSAHRSRGGEMNDVSPRHRHLEKIAEAR